MRVSVVSLVVLASVLLLLATLTATGVRRRGCGLATAIAVGVFFPVTWAVWYVRDEHPYERPASPE